MLQMESYAVDSTSSFDIEIATAPSDGKKYPIAVIIHGNLGLVGPFGKHLREFTQQIGALGYVAALPSYYARGQSNVSDSNIDLHVPAMTAAIQHLKARPDADASRLGLVGFSLGGGIATAYINASPAGCTSVFADFYGYVSPKLGTSAAVANIAKFPPTILFHNKNDEVVPPAMNSEVLADALAKANVAHEPVAPYMWYDEHWSEGVNHAFKPGGPADVDSRDRAGKWFLKHMPPVGKP